MTAVRGNGKKLPACEGCHVYGVPLAKGRCTNCALPELTPAELQASQDRFVKDALRAWGPLYPNRVRSS